MINGTGEAHAAHNNLFFYEPLLVILSPLFQMLRRSLPSWIRGSRSISSHQTSAGDEKCHFLSDLVSDLFWLCFDDTLSVGDGGLTS